MNSMTGYGRGEASNGSVSVSVEIRSVNNRFRDIQIRVPKTYLCLEPRLRKAVSGKLARGRIELFVHRDSAESSQRIAFDAALAESYSTAIQEIAARLGRKEETIPLSEIIGRPGVLVSTEHEPDANREWVVVSTALEVALEDLVRMRAQEGAVLRRGILEQLIEMRRLRGRIEEQTDSLQKSQQKKLEQRLVKLLGSRIDPARLAQEAAILVDKSDIVDELGRLHSHCDQLEKAVAATVPSGKKIDFLLQELTREINTIGSKTSAHSVSQAVIELKSVIERLREQAANIE
jgi:uncharacterized protein (TIGR00255 family)